MQTRVSVPMRGPHGCVVVYFDASYRVGRGLAANSSSPEEPPEVVILGLRAALVLRGRDDITALASAAEIAEYERYATRDQRISDYIQDVILAIYTREMRRTKYD